MGIVGSDLHALQRHHAHARVFQLARDELGQIALDLVGHLEGTVGVADFFAAMLSLVPRSPYSVRAISLISKNSS